MLAATVLALTAGNLLFYGFRGWSQDVAAIDGQRDAGFAIDLMNRALRNAAATNVTVLSSEVRVLDGSVEKSFAAAADRLVYDPDTSVNGDEMVVISSGLQSMQPVLQTNAVDVVLRLAGWPATMEFATHVAFRN